MRTIFTQFLASTVFAISLALSFSAAPASAAEGSQMTLSPTKQRIDIEAGDTYSDKFTIYNSGKTELKFKVYAAPYTVKSDANYTPVFSDNKSHTQISRWVKFSQTEFIAPAGKKIEVPYSVNVPANIPAGSQYAALFAETVEQGNGAVVAKKRVGMLLYAKPNGQTDERGSAEFAPVGMWQMRGAVDTATKITNQGNTDFEVEVTMRVASVFGGSEAFSKKETRTVLPGSTREIKQAWPNTPPVGLYKITQTAAVTGKTTSAEHIIIVVSPVILIIIAGAVIALIAWGVRRATRKSPTLGR